MYELVRNTYEYFFSIVSGYGSYEIKETKRNKTLIDNFVKLLPEETGEDWMFNYFAFQFFRYYDKKTRFGKGKVQLNWTIGKNAYEAWQEMSEEQRYLVDEFLEKLKIENPREAEQKPISSSFYENEKNRFLNTELGRINCDTFDLKYNSKSKVCEKCSFKNMC